ncbi:hypothetical protein HY640_03490 [Candidatus Woesearchaeota archaeon]|nr:hypothetical protein [Candidatus Woesearchaeota archaeon]
MKAQVSTEYMIVLGFALLLTIPGIIIFFSQSGRNVEQINSLQAKQIASRIVDNAEKVYYLGKPSSTTIKVVMPRGVESISVLNRAVVIRISGSGGSSDIVEVSSVNLTGVLAASGGVRQIRIESIGDAVNISYSR